MQLSQLVTRRVITIAAAVVVVMAVGAALAFEPVTRNFIAQDALCTFCHLEWEYDPAARGSPTLPHPATPDGGQALCIDCHLPTGLISTVFAYTHFASVTDLFGFFRDRDGERAGTWIPPHAATTYRVRDKLLEDDSSPCRTCHVESEIKPKKKRGQNAHKRAQENKETCINCHFNLVHRPVELREDTFKKLESAKKTPSKK